jgi:HD-GYP domain-containing protein (c-di-GMP phosphodiesterase class II)
LPDNATFLRIGGDEFFIIFYDMREEAVLPIIDMIDHTIGQESINGIRLSVSFGVQEHQLSETVMDSIRMAEKKMYNKKLSEVTSSRHETIRAILNTLHVKSNREESHSIRVSLICQKIGEALNLRREEIELLRLMATLHDIGKIAIDQSILNKPGPLTEAEWGEIKKHPETGYHILLASPEYAEIAEDILSHHERYDGKGYPRGLKGEDIPFRSRIIAIADSYDAMTTDRPYRDAMSSKQAYEEIKRNSGTQFDPAIAKVFLELLDKAETPI